MDAWTFSPAPQTVIPEPLQTIFLWATIIATAVILVWSLLIAKKYRSAVPVLMVGGGFTAIVLEPIVTYLGHAVHPVAGQIVSFTAVERAIPWHITLGYTAGFGLYYLLLYPKMVAGTVTASLLWKTTFVTALCYFLGEAYPVSNGLWIYYDHQPLHLWKGTAPLVWNFLNAACMLMGAALIHLLLPQLTGIKQLLVLVLAPMGALMGHMGAGWPMYNVMNTHAPGWMIEASGVMVILQVFLIVWICSAIMTRPR